MWQERIHGQSSLNDSATEPPLTSLALLFQVTPTLAWPQCSMIFFMLAGSAVPRPCTSTHTSTPASAAALPQGISDLPICSSVFSTATPLGRALGRTLTPRPPRSATSSMNCLHVSMFFFTSPGLREWNSQVVPQPQMATPAPANCLRTSLRLSLLRDGSTPWACVVRSSTGEMPTGLHTFSSVLRSQPAAAL